MSKNTAIYIADPSMLVSRVFDTIESIKSYEGISSDAVITGIRFYLSWGSVAMNIMPSDEMGEHLREFSDYASHVIKDDDDLLYTLARIKYVRMVLGCIVEHKEEDIDAVHSFLISFNGALNGLLFIYDSIIDWSGEALSGPMAATQS
ncbi:MAG: hypothetical protein ABI876_04395, partial [Bacteroidota bacterium]